MSTHDPAPVVAIYDALRSRNASWSVDVGWPSGPGWIPGTDLRNAASGSFNELLLKIGDRAKTSDRRTIAASFALRYGWASAMAIAPYLEHGCVPDVSLENVSFKFKASTFFEKTAIHVARGVMVSGTAGADHRSITTVDDQAALLGALRATLAGQATPVVDALHEWADFSRRGTWGMLTSSWVAQFTGLFSGNDQRVLLPDIERFLSGGDVVSAMRPRLHAVTCGAVTHLYQRRASCCRWYLLPQGDLCASCPLVPHDERLARNRAFMEKQLAPRVEKGGHS